MLKHLHISNYALISQLDIDFVKGFGVITGETGAGKSIILGALNLLMGGRADSKMITEGEQKCIIEAEFETSGDELETLLQKYDLDYDSNCLLRRELAANGKSRSFINDTPVTLGILREISDHLIDIHSQHENLLLQDDAFQLAVVDAVAKDEQELNNYQQAWQLYKQTTERLQQLIAKAEQEKKDADYIHFQYTQLKEAHLIPNETEELEQELHTLEHAEDIKTSLSNCVQLLDQEENGVLGILQSALGQCKHIAEFLPDNNNTAERLQSVYIELKDITEEAAALAEQTEYDPERQQRVAERLDLLNTLLQKHRKQSVEELIALQTQLESQLQQLESYDEETETLKKQQQEQLSILEKAGKALTKVRLSIKPFIEQQLTEQLTKLGIKHAQIEVRINETTHFSSNGKDDVQFFFAANKNQTLRNVAEVASGGETARIMLCIKALIADKKGLPTIIFDEIDTGVSGEVAEHMGHIMHHMAQERQILTITHLPQIAAQGDTHYKVYKTDTDTRTETSIRTLTSSDRITEIAQMLSGNNISEAAITNAKELLNNRL